MIGKHLYRIDIDLDWGRDKVSSYVTLNKKIKSDAHFYKMVKQGVFDMLLKKDFISNMSSRDGDEYFYDVTYTEIILGKEYFGE